MADVTADRGLCLSEVVRCVVQRYLDDMGDTPPDNLGKLVLGETERVLVRTVLEHTGGNQSRAAEILGVTRTTLRKRIRRYGLE